MHAVDSNTLCGNALILHAISARNCKRPAKSGRSTDREETPGRVRQGEKESEREKERDKGGERERARSCADATVSAEMKRGREILF